MNFKQKEITLMKDHRRIGQLNLNLKLSRGSKLKLKLKNK